MLRLFFLFLLLSSGTWIALSAQECHFRLSGVVLDGETGLPYAQVAVGIKHTTKGTLTDSAGRFEFESLCHGNYTLLISTLGYKSYEAIYHLDADKFDNIILHTDTCDLPSVTVTGTREEELLSLSRSSLNAMQLERLAGLSLAESLKELPGVTTYRTGTSISKPVVHGLYGNRIVIVNAGLRQEGQQWGNEHAPEIDPFVSDKLSVIKGAAGVRYGSDALAGVIIVEQRPFPEQKGVGGAVSLAGFSNNRQGTSSAMLEGRFWEKLPISWRIQGTLKKAGNTKSPQYYQDNTGFMEQNFSYALGVKKKKYGAEIFYSQFTTELGIFSGAHISSLSDLQNAIQRTQPAVNSGFSYEIKRPFQRVAHELLSAKSWWRFPTLGKLAFTYGRQFNGRSEFDNLRNSIQNASKDNPQLHYKLTTHTGDLILEQKEKYGISGSFGLSYMRQSNIWEGRFLIPNFVSNAYGVFLLEKWTRDRWTIEAGIRYDHKALKVYLNENGRIYSESSNFQHFSGTLGTVYRIHDHLSWRANFGSTWRAPSVNELYSDGLHHGAAAIEYGNKDLAIEQGYKAVSSLELSNQKMAMELTGYCQLINGYIYLRPDNQFVQTIRGAFPSFTYTQTDAGFFGNDFSIDYSFNKTVIAIGKSSMVWAKDVKNNFFLVNIPPIRYSLGLKIAPQTTPWARRNAPYLSITCLRMERQTRVENSSDYAPPPPAYTLLDTEIGFQLAISKQKMSVSLQVSNLFNVAYRDYMDRFRYYTDEMGRTISLRIKMPYQIYHPKPKTP